MLRCMFVFQGRSNPERDRAGFHTRTTSFKSDHNRIIPGITNGLIASNSCHRMDSAELNQKAGKNINLQPIFGKRMLIKRISSGSKAMKLCLAACKIIFSSDPNCVCSEFTFSNKTNVLIRAFDATWRSKLTNAKFCLVQS